MAAVFTPLAVALGSPQSSLRCLATTPALRSPSRLPVRVTAQASADSQISPASHALDLLKGVAAAAIVLSASATFVDPAAAGTLKATAVLRGAPGVEGTVTVEQDGDGPSVLSVEVSGLTPGKHGFHVHQFGDLTNGCLSTGGHFNPAALTHGSPDASVRHAGDLGNLTADEAGVAKSVVSDAQIPLSGPQSIVGRAFVVHEGEDDLGLGGSPLSSTTGNAGGRVACGVIGLSPVS